MARIEKPKFRYKPKGAEAKTISASDVTKLETPANKLWIGIGGDLAVITTSGDSITLSNVGSGVLIDFLNVEKVLSRGTTARNIVAIY